MEPFWLIVLCCATLALLIGTICLLISVFLNKSTDEYKAGYNDAIEDMKKFLTK